MPHVADLQATLATGLDQMGIEALRCDTKMDALILADALRNLASQAEKLAEALP